LNPGPPAKPHNAKQVRLGILTLPLARGLMALAPRLLALELLLLKLEVLEP
jgi:hypothetical protein